MADFEIRDPSGNLVEKDVYIRATQQFYGLRSMRDDIMLRSIELDATVDDPEDPEFKEYKYVTKTGYTIVYVSCEILDADRDMVFSVIKNMVLNDCEKENLCKSILKGLLSDRGIIYNPNNTLEELFGAYTALDSSDIELIASAYTIKSMMKLALEHQINQQNKGKT